MKLKVVSFNIRNADDADGHSIEERAPRLASVIGKRLPDVIGIQEYKPRWEEHFEKYFLSEYEIFNKYRCDEKPEAAPILWKKGMFECLDKGYFWLSDTPEVMSRGWDVKPYKRYCEYVILRSASDGVTFTFMNTHFGFSDDCQVKSARLIHEYAEKISDYPTFVTGDFNMTPDSLGYGEMTKHFTDLNAALDNDTRSTYHGYNPERYPSTHIDYCFFRAGVKPVSRELIDDTVDGKYPSDHYGLGIELEIH
jgi:endonuclease/exonuclease/phosphatase family metal-dependent hydrolase